MLLVALALCCVFCFVCLHPVFCVDSVAGVSGLSILDCFGFLQRLVLPDRGFEPTMYRTRGEHLNHYNTDVLFVVWWS